MGQTIHYIAGGEGVPEKCRERVAEALARFLDAMDEVSGEVKTLNYAWAVELFSGVYDLIVEFSTVEMGFDIRIVGSEGVQPESSG